LAYNWYKKASVQTALVSGAILVAVTVLVQFSPKARLEKEMANLNEQIQRLETQLAPFRAVAVERFGGNEQQALAKLAAQLEELQTQLMREAGTIRRFDIAAVATLTGDWKSTTPPDFSKFFRTGDRGSDIRIELKTNDATMRWVEFTESSPPRIVAGQGNSWVLDYTSRAPAGSWVLGVNRDDLQSCGTVEMRLYGIDYNATQDAVVTVNSLTLTFYVNGVPACRCEYRRALRAQLTQELDSPVRIQLIGPVAIEKIP
jgi:hypothetical protein